MPRPRDMMIVVAILVLLVLVIGWVVGDSGRSAGRESAANPDASPTPAGPADEQELINWTGFRGPGQHSRTSRTLPQSWAMDQGLAWITGLPGRGASTPVVHGDQVFLTAYDGYGLTIEDAGDVADLRHHVLCLDSRSGLPLWQRSIPGNRLAQPMNPELARHGFASSTPVTDGQRVYAFFGATGVFAFDRKGELLWQRNLGLGTNYFGSSASPLLFGDLLIVNASIESGAIYGLDRMSGAVVWWIPDVQECWSMPVIGSGPGGEPEMVVSSKHRVAGYDPRTGEELWHCRGIEDYVVSVPVIEQGVCYLSGGKEKQTMAIRLGGRGDVESSHKLWEVRKIGSNVSSPVFHDGRLYIFHDSGIVQVIRAADGKLLNRHRTATRTRPYASPLLAGEHLLMPFHDAGIGVFRADEQCTELTTNHSGSDEPLMASVVPVGNRFWFRSDRNLYCVDGGSGRTVVRDWQVPEDVQEIETRVPHNLAPERGWSRRYLLYLSPDPARTIHYLLMPYQSVISQEQTAEATRIVKDRFSEYQRLREQMEQLRDRQFSAPASQVGQYAADWQQLETATRQLNNDLRIEVKKLFTPQQMEQHRADAAAGRSHIKPDPDP